MACGVPGSSTDLAFSKISTAAIIGSGSRRPRLPSLLGMRWRPVVVVVVIAIVVVVAGSRTIVGVGSGLIRRRQVVAIECSGWGRGRW